MVQTHELGGCPKSAEHWWKLKERKLGRTRSRRSCTEWKILREKNFAFKRDANSEELARLCRRAERGMMSYYGRPVAELRQFCKQRGLRGTQDKKKGELVVLLEDADEEAQFPRFLELPPEIRVLVYEFSFDLCASPPYHDFNFRERAAELHPPPVTMVSRLLRKESLPIFYSSAVLKIEIQHRNSDTPSVASKPGADKCALSRQTLEIFGPVGNTALGHARKVELTVRSSHVDPTTLSRVRRSEIWEIKLPEASVKCQITEHGPPFGRLANGKGLIEGVRKMLDNMAFRPGAERLELQRTSPDAFLAVCRPFLRRSHED